MKLSKLLLIIIRDNGDDDFSGDDDVVGGDDDINPGEACLGDGQHSHGNLDLPTQGDCGKVSILMMIIMATNVSTW